MTKKKQPLRPRSIPQRTCIACREQEGKRALVRVVRGVNGVEVDPTGKLAGRGAYLHPVRACWENALASRAVQRALRTSLTADESARLQAYAANLPAAEEDEGERDETSGRGEV